MNPDIVLIPGFLGVNLVDGAGARVWLSPERLLSRDLADALRYDLCSPRLTPSGINEIVYGPLILALRDAGLTVHAFSFDFRKPLRDAALDLAAFVAGLDPDRRFVFVAHSEGALVATLYPYADPGWRGRVARAVFLGAPLSGSFEAVDCANDEHFFVAQLAALSGVDPARIGAMFRSWPSLFEMLPEPSCFAGGEAAFDAERWAPATRPAPELLASARETRRLVEASPLFELPCHHLISAHFSTAGAYAEGHVACAALRDRPGDGTVCAHTARRWNMRAHKADLSHTLLPLDPKAIGAACALALGRETDLAPLTDADCAAHVVGQVPYLPEMLAELARAAPELVEREGLSLLHMAWLLLPPWLR